jgi:hypothetical protein
VKEGKLSLADYKKLDLAELASLDKKSLKAVLSAYAGRPVSTDFLTFGQAGAQPIKLKTGEPNVMRDLIKLQREGKSIRSLSEDDKEKMGAEDDKEKMGAEDDKEKMGAEDDKEKMGSEAPKFDDLEEVMESINGMHPMLEKVCKYMSDMHEHMKKLMGQDDEQNGDEE